MLRLRSLTFVGLLAAIALVPQSGRAATEVETVLSWTDQDFSEGLAFSNRGDLYVGFGFSGDIVKVPRSGEASLFANIDPTDNSITLGLVVDPKDNVYAAVWGFDETTVGVWKITPDGDAARFAAMPTGSIPNVIEFDKKGNLLVTESSGAVWSVPRGGGDASLWVADDLLKPEETLFGANGMARRGDEVFVLNWEKGRIVSIPILHDGTAGTPALFLEDPELVNADGITFDACGNMYIGRTSPSALLRVTPSGEIETLVAFDESFFPFATNVAFGHGNNKDYAYLTGGDLYLGQPNAVRVNVDPPGCAG